MAKEKQHLDETLRLFLDARANSNPSPHDMVAISVYVHNLYMGMENIFRRILEYKNVRIIKTDSYHKELLLKAEQSGIVPADWHDTLSEYMSFRHKVVHGYGYMLERHKMQFLIDHAEDVTRKLFDELKKNGFA